MGLGPTTSASMELGVTGLMKAAFGFRPAFFFTVFFAMQSPLKTLNASMESTMKSTLPLSDVRTLSEGGHATRTISPDAHAGRTPQSIHPVSFGFGANIDSRSRRAE
jgi:hypothetical protein